MKKILITGANSFIGTSFEKYLRKDKDIFQIDTIDTKDESWKEHDFSSYDVVFDVAGIAHVNAKKSMKDLYYKVNTDLTIEIAKKAKADGVKQFIFMSSMIVYHESKSLKPEVINKDTLLKPNGFYGDSKLQAEKGLNSLNDANFKVVVLRPPMIYGTKSKGNFGRLISLSLKTPIFPKMHNKRSMLYIDNLCEFIKQAILHDLQGTFFPQNRELSDTLEIAKYFAAKNDHKLFCSKLFNIFVYIGSPFINAFNKMFATYYYDPELSKMDFDYQLVSQEESFDIIANNLKTTKK